MMSTICNVNYFQCQPLKFSQREAAMLVFWSREARIWVRTVATGCSHLPYLLPAPFPSPSSLFPQRFNPLTLLFRGNKIYLTCSSPGRWGGTVATGCSYLRFLQPLVFSSYFLIQRSPFNYFFRGNKIYLTCSFEMGITCEHSAVQTCCVQKKYVIKIWLAVFISWVSHVNRANVQCWREIYNWQIILMCFQRMRISIHQHWLADNCCHSSKSCLPLFQILKVLLLQTVDDNFC